MFVESDYHPAGQIETLSFRILLENITVSLYQLFAHFCRNATMILLPFIEKCERENVSVLVDLVIKHFKVYLNYDLPRVFLILKGILEFQDIRLLT